MLYILVIKCLRVMLRLSLPQFCFALPHLALPRFPLPCLLLSCWCLIALTFLVCKVASFQVTVVHPFWSWGSSVLCIDLSLLLTLQPLPVGKFTPALLGIKCYCLSISVTDEMEGQMLSSFMIGRTESISLIPMWHTQNLCK